MCLFFFMESCVPLTQQHAFLQLHLMWKGDESYPSTCWNLVQENSKSYWATQRKTISFVKIMSSRNNRKKSGESLTVWINLSSWFWQYIKCVCTPSFPYLKTLVHSLRISYGMQYAEIVWKMKSNISDDFRAELFLLLPRASFQL